MNIIIGADHAGYNLKKVLAEQLEKKHTLEDVGTFSEESCDYPDFAHSLCKKMKDTSFSFGILICGSAIGVSITANRHPHVRAAVCWRREIAELSRKHNNANVLCLPARFVSEKEAIEWVHLFIHTDFEGGRHLRRVEKI